jgi:hypothetical protein
MRAMVTQRDYEEVLSLLWGVSRVSVEEAGIGVVGLTVYYWIWLFMVPGLVGVVRRRVRVVIDAHRPYNIEVQMVRPPILAETSFQVLVAMVWAALLALLVRACL